MYEIYQHLPNKSLQKDTRKYLKTLYEAIPETEGCLENIKKENGCGSWCCESQSPQSFLSEFLYTWNTVKNHWTSEAITELVALCVENYFKASPSKSCVFWDRNSKLCKQHTTRPYNCRTYSQIPDEEFKPRYERLKVLYAEHPDALKEQCGLTKTVGNKPTVKDMDQWFNELMRIEMLMGVHPKMVHGESGGTYRTYHDHILLLIASPKMLIEVNELRMKGSDEQKKKYVQSIKEGKWKQQIEQQ